MKDKYVIFGCGQQGKNAFEHLNNFINIVAFSDNNSVYYEKHMFGGRSA